MGAESGMGGASTVQPPMGAPRFSPTGSPIQPTGIPPRQPGYDPGKPQPGPGFAPISPTGLPQMKEDDTLVKQAGPISAGNSGLGGLAQAFMGNQATQGSSLPQIMQAPQSPMPDIAAMLAQRKPGVQPVPPAPAQTPGSAFDRLTSDFSPIQRNLAEKSPAYMQYLQDRDSRRYQQPGGPQRNIRRDDNQR